MHLGQVVRGRRRVQPQPLELGIRDAGLRQLEQVGVDVIARDRLLGAPRQRAARGGIRGAVELAHQRDEIGVVVAEVVIRPGVDVDVGGLGVADDGQIEIMALEHLLEPLRPFEIGDLGPDPHGGELRRDDLAAAPGIGRRRQGKAQRQPLGPGGGQQRLRFLGVIGGERRQILVIGIVRREMGADRRAVTEHRAVDDVLAVDRMGDRLAHLHVVQRRGAVVHREDGLAFGGADHHLEARIGLELHQRLGGGEVREGVDIARHHCREGRGRVGDEAEGGLGERRLRAPVARIGGQRDVIALHPVGEREGAGADGMGGLGRDAFGGDDHRIAPGHLRREGAVGRAQHHLHRRRVDHLDRGDAGEEGLLRIGAVLGTGTVEAELHVLGVEAGAVVEGRAGDQMEDVAGAVLRHLPAAGKCRQHCTIGAETGQPLEEVRIDHLVDRRGGARGRVEVRRFQHHAQGDGIGRGGGGGCRKRKGGKRRGQAMGHRVSSGARRQGAVRAMIDAKPARDQGICAAPALQRGDNWAGCRAAAFFLCIAGPGRLRLRPEDEEPRDRGKP
ncbi:hypothetical protein SDC9_41675 [bioreactor metagenome]|uniref:Uncharacterized protein n=1 Tax=bioreactor metagenome TaxID=1076179 RepID=A0A644VVN4_9ZZZZ